jgi:hypothetical protein
LPTAGRCFPARAPASAVADLPLGDDLRH